MKNFNGAGGVNFCEQAGGVEKHDVEEPSGIQMVGAKSDEDDAAAAMASKKRERLCK